MTTRASLLAVVAAAALVVAAPARADEAADGPVVVTDIATAHVARMATLHGVKRHRPLAERRARRMLRRTLRADGFEAVSVDCARGGHARNAECRVVSAQRGGAVWSGRGTVTAVRDATRVTYALDSQPA